MLKVTFFGHSAFLLDNGKEKIVIDPFISGNPLATVKAEDIKADYIILTHAHGDHFGDSIDIAKNNDATIIALFELANYCGSKNVKVHPLGIGGSYNFPFGKVKFTIAHHSSSANEGQYMGGAAGAIVTIDSKNVYHCGDTGLFYDMKLIGEMTPIDLMLVPIGGNFTMDIDDAVKAVEFCKPKVVVPMHYNTFGLVNADANLFADKVSKIGKKALVVKPGETIDI
jgi:L-ascorbate metabolism protein UlaG (beta-lactamase superfamily)